jgi:hypothetical protein
MTFCLLRWSGFQRALKKFTARIAMQRCQSHWYLTSGFQKSYRALFRVIHFLVNKMAVRLVFEGKSAS